MSKYQIIDEPAAKSSDALIVNPIIILFVAIFLPLFFTIPYAGKLWLPFVWLGLNGYLLGSATLKKECLVMLCGSLIYVGVLFGISYIAVSTQVFANPDKVGPYLRIVLQAIFFLTLYIGVFMQSRSYSIYRYVEEGR